MTSDLPDAASKEQDRAFVKGSYLTYVVPHSTSFDPEDALRNNESNAVARIEQREWLFFDETSHVYVILQSHIRNQKDLQPFLRRISIQLEARVTNSHNGDRDAQPVLEVIYNGTSPDAEPIIVTRTQRNKTSTEAEDEIWSYAIWRIPVFLTRPRMRLHSPSVVFTVTGNMRPPEEWYKTSKAGYLDSRMPSSLNLLESFGSDPALGGVKPRLSAQRVSKVAPITGSNEPQRPLKAISDLSFNVFPAVHTRIRYARPNTVPAGPVVIAMLELDFTPFFECEVVLNKVDLSLPSATITDLNNADGLSLPLSCVSHDNITLLYQIVPREHEVDIAQDPTKELDISISATALVESGVCTPQLKIAWAATVDFTPAVNPGFGTASTNSMQRSHRPSQLSIDGSASFVAPAVSRPDALPSLEAAHARSTETTIPDFGITMTFTGPSEPVYAGQEFSWTVFVVNRTSSAAPTGATAPPPARKLALVVVPRRRRNEVRVMRPPSTAGHRTAVQKGSGAAETVADAVLDDNVVHAMHRSSLVDSTEVVCLSADTRVGPLAPNACHVVELRFLALKEGILGIEAVRVVDLSTQEHVDVRELPLMVVEGS